LDEELDGDTAVHETQDGLVEGFNRSKFHCERVFVVGKEEIWMKVEEEDEEDTLREGFT
jgi:hypothetical protein